MKFKINHYKKCKTYIQQISLFFYYYSKPTKNFGLDKVLNFGKLHNYYSYSNNKCYFYFNFYCLSFFKIIFFLE